MSLFRLRDQSSNLGFLGAAYVAYVRGKREWPSLRGAKGHHGSAAAELSSKIGQSGADCADFIML